MASALWQRFGDTLRPVTKAAREALAKIPDRDYANVEIRSKRSQAQADLYWSVLTKVSAGMNAANFAGEHWNKDKLHIALKMALGRYDVIRMRGKAVAVPHSMADFSQKEQGAYFDEAMDLLCRDMLPKIGDDALTSEIIRMLAPKADAA